MGKIRWPYRFISVKVWLTIASSIVFLVLCFSPAWSSPPELRVKYFSRTDGITNSYINQIIQDSTGFIWIGSRDGLYRYNGYGFKLYKRKQGDSTSLTDNGVNCFFKDNSSQLWIGTNQGICIYNEEQDNFIRIATTRNNAGLTSTNINQIFGNKEGKIFVCNGSSVYSFNPNSGLFQPVFNLPSGTINYNLIDASNNLWMACTENNGLLKLNLHTGICESVNPEGSSGILNKLSLSCLSIRNDSLWISTLGAGIMVLDIAASKLIRYPFFNKDDAMAVNVYCDKKNNIWTIDYTGLKFLDSRTNTFFGYYPQQDNPSSIHASIKGIFQDKQYNLWVYHEPGGVGIVMPQKGFEHFTNNPFDYWHTSHSNVVSTQIDSRGNLWMGFHQGGIDVFDWEKGTTRRYQHDEKNKYSLGRGSVLCIFRDSKNNMWVGTYFDGLQKFDPITNRFTGYINNPKDSNSIAGNDVRSITEDAEHNLWLAIQGKGIDKFDIKTCKFTHYNNANSNLSNNWTFQVLTDYKGDLWVASAWGLNHMKKGETRFNFFISDFQDSTTLTNSFITSLYEDKKHNLWIGTSSGLNHYNPSDNSFRRINTTFNNEYIEAIQEDRNGNIWISNLQGLAKLDPNTYSAFNFSTADGLFSEEFNARAVCKGSDGKLIFGGTSGVELFDPQSLSVNTEPPKVLINRFKLLYKEITPANSNKLTKDLSQTKKIVLHYSENVITIGFVALNFINPQFNQYAYKMEGFEKDWNYVGANREATYTNLNPGKYTFHVIAANNDGYWNTEGADLSIIILPPWYGTLLFKILIVIFILSAIIGYIALRTSALEKQRLLLEKSVKDKTIELSDMNRLLQLDSERMDEINKLLLERQELLLQQSEELKSQSERLEVANADLQKLNSTKDKIFSVIAHDLLSPFGSIIGFSNYLTEHYTALPDDEKLRHITTINQASIKLYGLLQNLLLWAQSQTSHINYSPRSINVKKLFEETIELRTESITEKKFRVNIDCKDDLLVWADAEMIKTIIRNLFSNAIKFTPVNGEIFFSGSLEDAQVKIAVSNMGQEISSEKINELLYSDMVHTQVGTMGEKGSGLGLIICRDFIRRNNGQLSISSIPGELTTFAFTLPVSSQKV